MCFTVFGLHLNDCERLKEIAVAKNELRFASEAEALQHLANVTGKHVKVAADKTTIVNETVRKFKEQIDNLVRDIMADGSPDNIVDAVGEVDARQALKDAALEAINKI